MEVKFALYKRESAPVLFNIGVMFTVIYFEDTPMGNNLT